MHWQHLNLSTLLRRRYHAVFLLLDYRVGSLLTWGARVWVDGWAVVISTRYRSHDLLRHTWPCWSLRRPSTSRLNSSESTPLFTWKTTWQNGVNKCSQLKWEKERWRAISLNSFEFIFLPKRVWTTESRAHILFVCSYFLRKKHQDQAISSINNLLCKTVSRRSWADSYWSPDFFSFLAPLATAQVALYLRRTLSYHFIFHSSQVYDSPYKSIAHISSHSLSVYNLLQWWTIRRRKVIKGKGRYIPIQVPWNKHTAIL